MTGMRPAEILRHLAPDAVTDAELLERFLRRDEDAFAVLVRRHGPMIFAVCRKITNHHQDAEDAFQAAFLILAKKATAIRDPKLLGNWLYGVAVRVSQKARRTAARRRSRETSVVSAPEPFVLPGEPNADYAAALHEELAKLPALYREALVLCELRGIARTEAAKILGIPEGTLSSRLSGGRKKLAERLTRRGVVLSTAFVPTALSECPAMASVPDSLLAKTCSLIAGWRVGAMMPIHLVRLTQGGVSMRSMLLGVLCAAATALGVVYAAQRDDPPKPDDPPKAEVKPVAAAVVVPKPDDAIVSFGVPRLRQAFDTPFTSVSQVIWSPDGSRFAVEGADIGEKHSKQMIITFATNDRKPGAGPERRFIDFGLETPMGLAGFSSDGKQIITELRENELLSGFHQLSFWEEEQPLLDLKAARTVDLDSERTFGYAFAADGKSYRTVAREVRKVEVVRETAIGSPSADIREILTKVSVREVSLKTGRTIRTLLQLTGEFDSFQLSRDGSRLVVGKADGVEIHDVATGKKRFTPIATSEPLPRERPRVGPAPALPPPSAPDPAPAFPSEPESKPKPTLKEPVLVAISSNGKRVFAYRQEDVPVILDGDTGKPLPKLEAIDRIMTASLDSNIFTAGGELVVVVGITSKKAIDNGQWRNSFGVWDTRTGKQLKSWPVWVHVAFHPTQPILAVLERNHKQTRVGLWDFSGEVEEKNSGR